jgi:type I restriction enzyme R subunit
VLDYFDAFLVGLTATPSRQTIGFFNENLVMEYTHRQAVADGINVPGDIYRIRTEVGEQGAVVAKGEFVGRRNRVTRALLQAALDDELAYQASQVGDDIITPSQIRTVIRTYKERVFTDLFPERQSSDGTPAILPKTLIFARNDNHAQEIVAIVREEFAEGNAFCRKITYRAEDGLPSELLNHFRNSFFPRVAVTVDMIATGTDIKTLEVLIFLRTVRSLGYFEQMRGRGTRVVKVDELQQATPNARLKDRFILVDAVGVTDSPLVDVTPPLERKRSVSLAALLDEAAAGNCDEALVATLAGRLAKVAPRLTTAQRYEISAHTGGSLAALLAQMEQALEPDAARQSAAARLDKAAAAVTEAEQSAAAAMLRAEAMRPFLKPALRHLLQEFSGKGDIIIDGVTLDVLTMADYSSEGAHGYIRSFREYIEQHKDEIAALRLLYSQPYGAPITFAQIKELGLQLQQPPHALTTERLWQAYAQVEKDRVRGAGRQRTLTDIVALVRHAIGHDEDGVLEPFPEQVQRRYERWLEDQQAGGRRFRPQQRAWLDEIARYMGVNLRVTPETLRQSPFANRGGAWAFREEFGEQWEWVLAELNEKLI